ncbi:MAG: glycoside hydrolase family 15 protein, partial [Rhizobiales bacterium]|nr:glycoside hydrolase family 15 protein [Hyphomicrobiales bacterium]
GPDMILLRTPARLHGERMKTVGEVTIRAGEEVPFVLSHAASHLAPHTAVPYRTALQRTEQYWRKWADRLPMHGPWTEAVRRSIITLKALTYAPTGGIVAAPTTSLPECLGGVRNWDYRFCWLRDATLTLLAMMEAGYFGEAAAWRDWLLRAVAGSPDQMQIMYGIAGERRLSEWELPWLPGYENSTPVRVGNGAHHQMQLDVYGELMDVFHQARRGHLAARESGWDLQLAVTEHLEKIWREPDHGIWESRDAPRHFTYSKVMCWVAFDRMIKSAKMFDFPGPVDKWRRIREEIRTEVLTRGYDAELGSFVQYYGSKELDASLLLLPNLGFLPPEDPRIHGTIAAIEKRLLVDGFVMRYDTATSSDGLPPGEGAFLACSFWLADAYCLTGRTKDARRLFERLVGL